MDGVGKQPIHIAARKTAVNTEGLSTARFVLVEISVSAQ